MIRIQYRFFLLDIIYDYYNIIPDLVPYCFPVSGGEARTAAQAQTQT
jgi:hypothetical protein